MADHHSSHNDYVHGEMDINQHRHSYELFTALTKWGSYYLAVILTFIIVLTCVPGAGFFGALIPAVVIAVVGWLMLKKKPDTH